MKILTLCLFFAVLDLKALPRGGKVEMGDAKVSFVSGREIQIQTSDQATIHWKEFSIGEREKVSFLQPHSTSTVLNYVIGDLQSDILGTLEANGRVYLVNPNGVLIGPHGVIKTAGFLASTLTPNNPFEAEISWTGSSEAMIINLGTIECSQGDIYLLGCHIMNEGYLTAPNGAVGLGSGSHLLLKPAYEQKIYIRVDEVATTSLQNNGYIGALRTELRASGNPYEYAVKHTGLIEAYATEMRGGEVYISAEKGVNYVAGEIIAPMGRVVVEGDIVHLTDDADIDTSGLSGGGKIFIGGSFQGKDPKIKNAQATFIDLGAALFADAIDEGDGGEVIVWADGVTSFLGTIYARASSSSGDGGFAEVSGKGHLNFQGHVDLSSRLGAPGTLLLDPTDVTISTLINSPNIVPPGATYTFVPAGTPSNINNAGLGFLLAGGTSAIISTSAAMTSAAAGTITVTAPVIWNHNLSNLTLIADSDILISDSIIADGLLGASGYVSLYAGYADVVDPPGIPSGTGGNVTISATGIVPCAVGSRFNTTTVEATTGSVSVGSLTVSGGSAAGLYAMVGIPDGVGGAPTGNISITTGNGVGGGVTVIGGIGAAAVNCTAQIGHITNGVTSDASGNITLSGGDLLFVFGGLIGATQSPAQIGHLADSAIGSASGVIDISVNSCAVLGGGVLGGSTSPAQIGHMGRNSQGAIAAASAVGDINVTTTTNCFVSGGDGTLAAIAQIGHLCSGAGTVTPIAVSGNILVSAGTDVTIIGGTNTSAAAQIGHNSVGAISTTIVSNVLVEASGSIFITGGSGRGSEALLGHLARISAGDLTGNVTANAVNDIFIVDGTSTMGFSGAYIGAGMTGSLGSRNSNISVNAGRNLDIQGGRDTQGAGIVLDSFTPLAPVTGDIVINAGLNMYLHMATNHNPVDVIGIIIGGTGPAATYGATTTVADYSQNLFINVGQNFTCDARNGAGIFISPFNHHGNFTTQNITHIHVGGDACFIAGDTVPIPGSIHFPHVLFMRDDNATFEFFALGDVRCYNGATGPLPVTYFGDASLLVANPDQSLIANLSVGMTNIRTGGNVVLGGGNFSRVSDSTPETRFVVTSGAETMFIRADAPFAAGALWPTQVVIVGGSNIFLPTPLGVPSAITPSNGRGGMATDNAGYETSLLPPTTVTGIGSLASPIFPTAPSFPGLANLFFSARSHITFLSADRYSDTTPADFTMSFLTPNQPFAISNVGNITIAGFRNIDTFAGPITIQLGNILIIAQNDITMQAGAFTVAAADLTFVCDNQAPTPPQIGGVWGTGRFIMDATAQAISGNAAGGIGNLQIFTARQPLNLIAGLLNGSPFVAGPTFVDSAYEHWCVYFDDPYQNFPFVVFYKDCVGPPALAAIPISEALVALHPYDEDLGWKEKFTFYFEEDLFSEVPWYFRHKKYRINNPKSYTTYIGPIPLR